MLSPILFAVFNFPFSLLTSIWRLPWKNPSRLGSELVLEQVSLKANHGFFREFEKLIGSAT